MTSLLDHLLSHLSGKSGEAALRAEGSSSLVPDASEDAYAFVYVEDDGTARELEPDEIEYLGTKFEGGEGNRPHIKGRYEELTPDKRMHGYLLRKHLPATVRIRALTELTPVDSAEAAIEIAKMGIPMSFCIKSGTPLGRVIDPRTGKRDFGLPGVDVRTGKFSAELTSGVWHVVRTPDAPAEDNEKSCYADVSALSGRIMRFGWRHHR